MKVFMEEEALDVNIQGSYGYTALMWTVKNGDDEMTEELLDEFGLIPDGGKAVVADGNPPPGGMRTVWACRRISPEEGLCGSHGQPMGRHCRRQQR